MNPYHIDVVQTGINAPKPTNSTPNYAPSYGPEVARPSSTSAPSQNGPIIATEEPTFGPQDPFCVPTAIAPSPTTRPHLPPCSISRHEIAARVNLYQDGLPKLPETFTLEAPIRPTTQRPAPSFGSTVAQTLSNHLLKHSRFTQLNVIQIDPAMAFSSEPAGLSGFDPELQTKFPEVYALAVQVDQFGKNQVALLKVTMEQQKPRPLLKEFTWMGRLLKKGTGHDLYTPGVHPFRLRYRDQVTSAIKEIVQGEKDKKKARASMEVKKMTVPLEDHKKFVEVVETELMGLHEGNIARYRISLREYIKWRSIWA